MSRGFDELVAEAESASVDGWDFSWLDGRATEQRPSWGYQRLMGERLGRAGAALDIQTGGGEVLAAAPSLPPVMAATESWPPNIAKATALLRPRGVVVVADPDEPPLPFADSAFDLVTSRTPSDGVVDRNRAGTRTGRNVLRSTCGSRQRVRTGRVLSRSSAAGSSRTAPRGRNCRRDCGRAHRRRPFVSSVCAWNSSTSAPLSTSYAR